MVGRDCGKTGATMAAKIPKYARRGLIFGQAFFPLGPLELLVSDPDGGSEGTASEFLTCVTVAVPHIGDVTDDLVLHTLTKTAS